MGFSRIQQPHNKKINRLNLYPCTYLDIILYTQNTCLQIKKSQNKQKKRPGYKYYFIGKKT